MNFYLTPTFIYRSNGNKREIEIGWLIFYVTFKYHYM